MGAPVPPHPGGGGASYPAVPVRPTSPLPVIDSATLLLHAAIFDLDGVLIDSEPVWARVREAYVRERGGQWPPGTQAAMMGMSTREWASFLHHQRGVPDAPEAIAREVGARIVTEFADELPLLPGAQAAVRRMRVAFGSLAVASSSPRPVILRVLELSGLAGEFAAVTSSDEVARGKPAPDVYLLAAERLGLPAHEAVAIEDSTNGLRSAAAAGCRVVAVPRPEYPPAPEALALAAVTIASLDELTVELLSADAVLRPGPGSPAPRLGWRGAG